MRTVLVVAVTLGLARSAVAGEIPPAKTGTPVAGFTLKDGHDKSWSLDDVKNSKAVVVAFLGVECPVNNAYLPRLAELHGAYSGKGVAFVGINSNWQDSALKVQGHAEANKIPFPVLKDPANAIADAFSARRTPEVFVLDPERKIVYQGRIDDQVGIGFKRPKATEQELVDALEAVLAGKKVAVAITAPPGCLISRVVPPKATGTYTYTQHVAAIFQKHCQECHRAGQVGPFALTTYEEAVNWSEMIREVVSTNQMPPWHADPKHGQFSNDRRLSDDSRKALLGWIEQGCPKGEGVAPAPKEYVDNWRIGKPDVVFEMPKAFTVPAAAKDGVKYQNFVVPTNFTEDKWIVAAEARPGNRSVVHHILVLVRMPGVPRTRNADGIGQGLLTAFAPGDVPLILQPGQAKKIPKGAVLVFQMHYTPNGTEQTDRSSVGLVFAKEEPKEEIKLRAIAQQSLFILPGVSDYQAKSSSVFSTDKETIVYTIMPHMHLRGKSFEVEAIYPDGKTEILLSVPKYDFGWQTTYMLKEPKRLPAGTRVECRAVFDNSSANPNNPNPSKFVFWGDQTWEEMMIGFVHYRVVEK
jgi:peroxiredoxin/mono/diheme cytochrome c family protein